MKIKLVLLTLILAAGSFAWAQATVWEVYCVDERAVIFNDYDFPA